MKAGRRAEGEYPNLMGEDNVVAMFGLLDVVGQGHITAAQHREGAYQITMSVCTASLTPFQSYAQVYFTCICTSVYVQPEA